ncbi:ADP-ribosylation factor GTPase activating protein 1, isoform CRA_c [Rattus norvegicus]|uniref:ADP-ribosylation factor GTPase activating protein 1, isoform CRA_c n=1 Tax=Rattus norvegicus TaxID=10116 RepID=A6KM66_RAT|nr:ADP-ribosylation factor GTPase activating protein 1, isoform CRA_c [Rattus norvegicus]
METVAFTGSRKASSFPVVSSGLEQFYHWGEQVCVCSKGGCYKIWISSKSKGKEEKLLLS